jgi:hypothetical protein
VSTICSAPAALRIGIYSALLTVQIGVIPDFRQSFMSILPICEDAPVMITHLDFNYLSLATMHTAVIGLMMKDATSSNCISSLMGKA